MLSLSRKGSLSGLEGVGWIQNVRFAVCPDPITGQLGKEHVLVRVSVAVKRHHDHGNSYK